MSELTPILDRLRADGSATFRVKVTPKSSRTQITGSLPDGTLKIKVAAAPEKGKANKELCAFLADQLRVPKTSVTVTAGHTSALKRITVKLK